LIDFYLNYFVCLLEEATTHFRKAFPDLVRYNDDSVLSAFARMFKIFLRQRGIKHDVRVFTYTEDGNKNNNSKKSS
jgi:hypothetical protein